ncbi:MAG: hypothetical protein MRY72_13865 [Aquisalinus sp.]|nr:hypothetical protein [Aquisalinus sp.]
MSEALLSSLKVFPVRAPREKAAGEDPDTIRQAIRDEAYTNGFEKGYAQAEADLAERQDKTESALADLLGKVDMLAASIETEHHQALRRILIDVLPALAEQQALDEIAEIIKEAGSVGLAGTITVQANAKMRAALESKVTDQALRGRLSFQEVPQQADYVIDLAWENGGAQIDTTVVIEKCLGVLNADTSGPEIVNNAGKQVGDEHGS